MSQSCPQRHALTYHLPDHHVVSHCERGSRVVSRLGPLNTILTSVHMCQMYVSMHRYVCIYQSCLPSIHSCPPVSVYLSLSVCLPASPHTHILRHKGLHLVGEPPMRILASGFSFGFCLVQTIEALGILEFCLVPPSGVWGFWETPCGVLRSTEGISCSLMKT